LKHAQFVAHLSIKNVPRASGVWVLIPFTGQEGKPKAILCLMCESLTLRSGSSMFNDEFVKEEIELNYYTNL